LVWEKVRIQFQHEKENAEQSKTNDVAKYVVLRWTVPHNTPLSVGKGSKSVSMKKKMQSNQKKMMLQNT